MAEGIEQGEFCPRCKNFIPRFRTLDESEEMRLRSLSPVEAIKELRQKTGCGIATAKIWVLHPTGPHAAKIHPPCPYCSAPLFSMDSRQCVKCGWDWHDQAHPVKRATEPPDREALNLQRTARWERYRNRRS